MNVERMTLECVAENLVVILCFITYKSCHHLLFKKKENDVGNLTTNCFEGKDNIKTFYYIIITIMIPIDVILLIGNKNCITM